MSAFIPPLQKIHALLFATLVAFSAFTASAVELRPFDAKSVAEITKTNEGRPFVLAFWSIHCAPCKEEMGLFKAIKQKYPDIPIILVATDPPEANAAVVRFLESQGLKDVETWVFDDEFIERVRYSVDPQWMGELPRAYFYDASHRTTSHSGLLDPTWVETWMAEQSAPSHK